VRALVVSTYELGHQPLHAAWGAASLLDSGAEVRCLDLSLPATEDVSSLLDWADLIAVSVPMHTAMRLALGFAGDLKERFPDKAVCFFGLYAPVGKELDRPPVDYLIGGEYAPGLAAWAKEVSGGANPRGSRVELGRGGWPALPARSLLPPLERYARLVLAREEHLVGYVETTRGCIHRCRHCPVPVVYNGRIRLAGLETVLRDIDQLVAMGASHISFGDPDFLSGPHYAARVIDAVSSEFPGITFDLTAKVSHILAHGEFWPKFQAAGCLFVTSAFESTDPRILDLLHKGHSPKDASRATELLRSAGIEPRPTWIPFTPWTTPETVADILDFVAGHDLVDSVDLVQYSLRLLVPPGSLLLSEPKMRQWLGPFDSESLSWSWRAPGPGLDELQAELWALAEAASASPELPSEHWDELCSIVSSRVGRPVGRGWRRREPPPRLSEPWFCCAEPTSQQVEQASLAPPCCH
jgi:hypothetical protein